MTGTSYLGNLDLTADNITVNNLISRNADMVFHNSTSSEIMRIDQDGFVGIRTATPLQPLHINSLDGGSTLIQFTNIDTTLGSYVGIDSSQNLLISQRYHSVP